MFWILAIIMFALMLRCGHVLDRDYQNLWKDNKLTNILVALIVCAVFFGISIQSCFL